MEQEKPTPNPRSYLNIQIQKTEIKNHQFWCPFFYQLVKRVGSDPTGIYPDWISDKSKSDVTLITIAVTFYNLNICVTPQNAV